MLGLLLAAMGVLGASLVVSDQNDDDKVSNEGPPDEDDVGEEVPPITLPEEPVVDGPRQFGMVALSRQLEDDAGTPFDDVIAIDSGFARNPSGAGLVPVFNSVDAGAGNDRLYVSGGTGIGGEGDDTISLFEGQSPIQFSGTEFEDLPGVEPVALGGPGDDVIEVFVGGVGVIDAGEGNDTVDVYSFRYENAVDVTLGDGDDLIRYFSSRSPGDVIAQLHDFNPAEDRIEIVRDIAEGSVLGAMTGFEVTITPGTGEEPSVLAVTVTHADPALPPEVYRYFADGLDATQADEIRIGFVDDLGEEDGTPIEPLRDGSDLVFTLRSEDLATLSAQTFDVSGQDGNSLADITRVVLNIDETIEGTFEVHDSRLFIRHSGFGDGITSHFRHVVFSPAELDGATVTEVKLADAPFTFLSIDGPPEYVADGLLDLPQFLAPNVEVVRLFRGERLTDTFHPENERNTVNDIEIVINRVALS